MSDTPQKRAVRNYRKRLIERGLSRIEVLVPTGGRELIRELAKRLAEGGEDAARIRAVVREVISLDPRPKGGIWRALRRSPAVGADLDLRRPFVKGRKVDL